MRHSLTLTFHVRLHAAVRPVGHPSGDAFADRHVPHEIPEADALYASDDDETPSNAHENGRDYTGRSCTTLTKCVVCVEARVGRSRTGRQRALVMRARCSPRLPRRAPV